MTVERRYALIGHTHEASGGGTWGSITGTLSDQLDLQSALDGKAASSHTHSYLPLAGGTVSGYTTFQNNLEVSGVIYEGGTALSSKYLSLSGGTLTGPLIVNASYVANLSPLPTFIMRNTAYGSVPALQAYISLQNNAASEVGWLGFGSGSDNFLSVVNALGPVRLYGITGGTQVWASSNSNIPALGYADESTALSLRFASDPAYGLHMGVIGDGRTWIQSGRADGWGVAYDLILQPRGGQVDVAATSFKGKTLVSDWNEASVNVDSAFSFGRAANNLTNSPQNYDNANGYLMLNFHAGNYGRQFGFVDLQDGLFTRLLQNGSWLGWRRIVTLETSSEYLYLPAWLRFNNGVGIYTNASDYIYNYSGSGWRMRGGQATSSFNYLLMEESSGTVRGSLAWNSNTVQLYGYGYACGISMQPYQSYGTAHLYGSYNNYCGLDFASASNSPTVMFETGAFRGGFYSQAAALWMLYFNGTHGGYSWYMGNNLHQIPNCSWSTNSSPASATFSRGTAAPTGGSNGDVYFQYT